MTASLEIQSSFKRNDGSLIDLAGRPTTILPIDVDIDSVLDLTDDSLVQMLNTNYSELKGEWRYSQISSIAITQVLGRAAFILIELKP